MRAAFWSTGALVTLALAAWMILQWGIVPHLERWKPELEAWASRSLGVEVRLGTLQVRGGVWTPVVTLRDLRIVDGRGQETLRLAKVEAVFTPGSLWPRSPTRWMPHVQRLELEALHLALRRDPRGQVFLAGLALDGDTGDGRMVDWLFSQSEIRLRQASVSWQDEQRSTEPLVLTDVDLDLRNPLGRHVLRLSATPPQGWGSRFFASAEMARPLRTLLSMSGLQHPGDWRQWVGVVHAEWPRVDVSRLRRHVDLPFDLLEGRGRLATRIDVAQGRLTGATADLQLEAVTLRVAKGLPPVALRRIAGQLAVQHHHDGSVVKARRLSFQSQPPADATATSATPDPSLWPATDLELSLRGEPGAWTGGAFKASLVDLGLLAQSAAHVPLAGPMRRLLEATRPRGQVHQFAFEWGGDVDSPTHWRARGDADALSLAAAPATAALTASATPGRPGLRGGRVRFDATERGGQADLRILQGELEFPGVFEQPRVALDQFKAEVRWQLRRPGKAAPGGRPAIDVEVRRAVFATADGDGEFSGHWRSGPPGGPTFGRQGWLPGELDLDATVHHIRADRIHRYLPLGIDASVRGYVRDAVQAGAAHAVRARVRGSVLDFPFTAPGQGEFAIGGRFEGVTLDAVPGGGWPRYTDGTGQLVIDGQQLRLMQVRARLGETGSGGFTLDNIEGGIHDFADASVLRLRGQGQGATADVLAFLRTSPIDGWLGHAFTPAKGDGRSRLALALDIPLLKAEDTTVRGQLDLADTQLQMRPDTPALAELQARIHFTEHSFQLSQGKTQAAGGALAFEGFLDDGGILRFSGQGRATAQGLRTLDTVRPLAQLAHAFDGQADYRLQLDLTPGGPTVQVDSDLVGLASRLPAPLGKPAAQAEPLRVRVEPQQPARPSSPTLLQIDAGTPAAPRLHARLLLGGVHADTLLGGQVQVGTPDGHPWPAQGLGLHIGLPRLSLDDWQTWLQQATQAGHLPSTDPGTANTGGGAMASVLREVRLQVADLTLHGRRFSHVTARLQPTGPTTAWSGRVDADQLAGQITLRPASAAAPPAIQARLSRLVLPWSADPLAARSLSPTASMRTADPLPALDLVVDELVHAGRSLGRLVLQGATDDDRGAWQLRQLSLTHPEARLSASGRWEPSGPTDPGASHLDFRLEVADGGQWLDQLGWVGTLRGGSGQIHGQLRWPGPPAALAMAQLGGQLRLDIGSGQLLQADPGGAGRLLGVLNLQSLPRRLALDFRDVYQKGFSFDHIDGDVQIRQGLASTHNLRVRGVQAVVLAEGSASLPGATQNLRVWVVPDFNAGAASLAYAVINPAVGLGTLVTQWLLQRPLAEAATREFQVTGRWDAPLVTPVDRALDARPPPGRATAAEPFPSLAPQKD